MFPTTEYENISIQITSRRSIIQLSYENYAIRLCGITFISKGQMNAFQDM